MLNHLTFLIYFELLLNLLRITFQIFFFGNFLQAVDHIKISHLKDPNHSFKLFELLLKLFNQSFIANKILFFFLLIYLKLIITKTNNTLE